MKQWSCSLWVKQHAKDDKSTLGFWLLGCFYKIGFWRRSRCEHTRGVRQLFRWWGAFRLTPRRTGTNKKGPTNSETESIGGHIFCSVPSSTPTTIPRCWATSKESSWKFTYVSRSALHSAEQSWATGPSKGQMSKWQFWGWFWDGRHWNLLAQMQTGIQKEYRNYGHEAKDKL